jgi:hypothetical protein
MATQKPLYFDGRQLRRASSTNPIAASVLESTVVTTDGLHPFVANVAGAKATEDAHLTTRLVVDRRIADGYWGGPVQAITNTPPVSPGAEQRWITGTLPTGDWSGNPNAFAAYRDGVWKFTSAAEGVFVFNRATHSYVHYTGSAWAPILGTGTVTSVGLALPAEFDVTVSPVTGSGDLTAGWAVQAPGVVFAGPSDPLVDPAVPGFRPLVETDIPFCALKGDVGSSGLTMTSARLLGRISDDPGAIEEISIGDGLSLSAGQLSCTVSPALETGRVGFGGSDDILTGSIYLTYVSDGDTGGLVISNTTASTSTTTGALVVTGGLGVGGTSFFGGRVDISCIGSTPPVLTINQNSYLAADGGGNTVLHVFDHEDTLRGKGIRYTGGFGATRATGRAIYVAPWLTVFVCTGITTPPSRYDRYTVNGITYAITTVNGSLVYAVRLTSSTALPPASGKLTRTVGSGDAEILYTEVSLMETEAVQASVIIRSNGAISFGNIWENWGNVSIGTLAHPGLDAASREQKTLGVYETTQTGEPDEGHLSVYGTIRLQGIQSKDVANGILQYNATNKFQGYYNGQWNTFLTGTFFTNRVAYGGALGITDSANLTFDGANLNVTGTVTAISADLRDGLQLMGRAGGTGSYLGTFIPTTLTESRTYTMPDKDGTVAMTSDIVAPSLADTQVGFGSGSDLLTGSANLTYISTLATGGLTISNTTASTSTTTGALVVAGGLGVGGSVYAGSDVSVGGTLIIKNVNEAVNTIGNTGTGTITVNCLTANRVTMTVTGNVTLAFTNVPSAGTAKTMVLHITNGAAFTFAFPANTRWSGGIAPVLRSSGLDIIGLTTIDGGNTWDGIPMSLDSKVP